MFRLHKLYQKMSNRGDQGSKRKSENSEGAVHRSVSYTHLDVYKRQDVDESLTMAAELMESDTARKKIQQIKEKMNNGIGFAEAIVETGMFGGLYGKMITVGFKTGTLDGVMKKVAQHYEEEIDRKLSGIIAAVSYTHLDVYKRQISYCSLRSTEPIWPCKRTLSRRPFNALPMLRRTSSPGINTSIILIPVS